MMMEYPLCRLVVYLPFLSLSSAYVSQRKIRHFWPKFKKQREKRLSDFFTNMHIQFTNSTANTYTAEQLTITTRFKHKKLSPKSYKFGEIGSTFVDIQRKSEPNCSEKMF